MTELFAISLIGGTVVLLALILWAVSRLME